MPLNRLDTDQRKAASAGGMEVVVSAGAGSGKTRLLVGRYLHLLESRVAAMHEIAAITFTEKAANQMKFAIAAEARSLAGQEDRDRRFWLEVADAVHGAPISTIHGFCNAILRSHPVEGRLDPLFDILDGATVSVLAAEAVERFIRDRLDTDPEGIERLIRDFGMRGLKRMFGDLLGQRARLSVWLDQHGIDDAASLEKRYESYLITRMEEYRRNLEQFHAIAPGDDSLAGKIGEILPALEVAVSMMEEGRLTAPVIDDIAGAIGTVRGGSKNKWDSCGCDVAEVRGCIKDCREFLGIVWDYYRRDKGVTAYAAHVLLKEFVLLERQFLELKKARSAFDHDDTLIETWRLLRTDAGVLHEVARSFRHIMVDEFQDTDGLQMDILRMVAGNGVAVFFAVGDPKQSIYRFRGADVTIFNEFVGRVSNFIRLRKNYRSDPGIIEFVNRVFGRVMGDEPSSGGGSPAPFEAVYSEMRPPVREPVIRPATGIAVFEHARGDDWRPREAAWIAAKMRDLHERGNLPYSDMALILRKSTHAPVYQEAFLERGIPYVDLAGNKPFAGEEARDIGNLLTWLCDPGDPAAFTALLLSPFIAAEASHIFALRCIAGAPERMPETFLAGEGVDRHPWLEGLDMAGLRKMLTHLLALRDRASIREVIETAFGGAGYTAALLADPVRGELALSVTDMILDATDSFERNGGNIREFANLLADGSLECAEASGLESRDDAVSIITIHKAKGLEYHAVFCADISGRPRNDLRPIVIDHDLGIGFTMRDACGKNARTIVSAIGQETEKRKNIAESKRLFYVACTRARSHLYLSGEQPPSSAGGGYDSDNWMEWIHSALELSPSGEPGPGTPGHLFGYERFAESDTVRRPHPADYWADVLEGGESGDMKTIPGPEEVAGIDALVSPRRESPAFPPAHLSPSQIEDYLACPALYRFRHIYHVNPPRKGDGIGYGPRYGSFAHGVLERWDFRESAESLITSAKPDDPSWRELLSGQLDRFRETRLYRDILSSGSISRETPFVFLQDDIMVRGTIDCIVEREGGGHRTVIDFKTDRIDPGTAGDAAKKYRLQLALYALAVQRAFGEMPDSLVLYFLDTAETVSIPCIVSLLRDAEEAISRAARGIARGEFEHPGGEQCGECPYQPMCSN